jgi:hypothetical protein
MASVRGALPAFASLLHSRVHPHMVRKADNIAVEAKQNCGAVAQRNGLELHPAIAAIEQLGHHEFQLIRFCVIIPGR